MTPNKDMDNILKILIDFQTKITRLCLIAIKSKCLMLGTPGTMSRSPKIRGLEQTVRFRQKIQPRIK